MSATSCAVSRDLANYQRAINADVDYQARVEAKTVELRAQYRSDGDVLWESLGNVTARKPAHQVAAIIKVLRDGGTTNELAAAMYGLRELMFAECDDTAEIRALQAVQNEDARAEREKALRAFHGSDEL